MQQISDEAYDSYLRERGLTRTQYTTMELLAVAAAREVPDGAFVFAGTGLPLLASMLAQFTVAPNMTLIMEAGIVGPKVEHLRSEEHTSELQSQSNLVCRLLLEK